MSRVNPGAGFCQYQLARGGNGPAIHDREADAIDCLERNDQVGSGIMPDGEYQCCIGLAVHVHNLRTTLSRQPGGKGGDAVMSARSYNCTSNHGSG